MNPISKPLICGIDLSPKILTAMATIGFEPYNGTLGSKMEIPNIHRGDSKLALLDFDFPDNFHEYDILVVDLTNSPTKGFEEISNRKTSKSSNFYLECSYPATVFDSRPCSASILQKEIRGLKNRNFIQIIFASQNYEIKYEVIEVSNSHNKRHDDETHFLFALNPILINSTSRYGEQVTICPVESDFDRLLKKYSQGLIYHQVFDLPKEWDKEQGKLVLDSTITPLYENKQGEIVSFIEATETMTTFVFPDIEDKAAFLKDLFSTLLPKYFPDFFPYSTQFSWLDNSDYFVPNHQKLISNKLKLKEEFEKQQAVLDETIKENKQQFSFLHDLLTETDAKLVKAVYDFLLWLGFENVIIKDDESKSIKEEDLQVTLDDGLLVIETKGIGGTSTDSDCSQVYKIKNRRSKERNKFDVKALYIVNHQRFLPPLSRQNPPFTEHQINDALNDERGLVTTWQLFTLYYQIERGDILREDAREQLLAFGLVKFRPKVKASLGRPTELYQKNQVAILTIKNTPIKSGDTIALEKDGHFRKAKIVTLKLNDKVVNEVSDGEIGIELDEKMTSSTILWTLN